MPPTESATSRRPRHLAPPESVQHIPLVSGHQRPAETSQLGAKVVVLQFEISGAASFHEWQKCRYQGRISGTCDDAL